MGTIAELLGYSLSEPTPPEGPGSEAVPTSTDIDEGGAAAVGSTGAVSAAPGQGVAAAPTPDEVVLAAVLAETSLEPSAAREDLTLAGDLDLDTIGRYAVVTAIEHGLGTEFRDEDVDAWETLGDVLAAARP